MKKIIACIFCLSLYTVGFGAQAQTMNNLATPKCWAKCSSCKDGQEAINMARCMECLISKCTNPTPSKAKA